MALPPSAAAVHDTVAAATPAVAVTAVGLPGTVATVAGSDAAPEPLPLVAVTVKV